MILKPSKKITKVSEEYTLGKLRVPDYEAGGKIDIGVLVLYTKETDDLEINPTRECARFKADCVHDYFTGSSIYGGYVKYTLKDGSTKRMLLHQGGRGEYSRDEEIDPRKLDSQVIDTRMWGEDMIALIDQLPTHVRDLFNLQA